MRIVLLFFLLTSVLVTAQKNLAFDSLKLKDAQDFFVDDYQNIYLYKNKDFSFTKYDSLGKQLGRVMMTVPFRVQSVQNPLNIVLFSENAQEMKLLDQNLNEIQKIDFRQKFGFVKNAYEEDLQQIWLLDESSKRLIQYNYRQDLVLNSYPFEIDLDKLIAILVFENKLYAISENTFTVYNFKAEKLTEFPAENPRKLYRENRNIYIVCENAIQSVSPKYDLQTVFTQKDAKIVDKNSASYFELKGSKLYLYPIQK